MAKKRASCVNMKRAVALAMDLMRIPGPSGREGAVAAEIVSRLRKAGLADSAIRFDAAHKRSCDGGECGNLIVRLPGTVRRPRRLLSAHMDTVSICVGSRPVVKGGRIVSADPATALGGDDRAGTAVLLHTLLAILRERLPHPPLAFLWTVQEELGLQGARHVSVAALGRPAMGFNYDGSGGIVRGATGDYRIRITVTGVPSHAGAAPEKGVSAVTVASLAIARLHKAGWIGAVRKGRRRGTSNVCIVEGGAATNVVCPRAVVHAEARSHDPAFRREIVRAYRRAFAAAAKAVRNDRGRCGKVTFRHALDYESFCLAADEPVVVAAIRAARAVGASAELKIANGGVDANWLVAHGIPAVTLGAGNRHAHTAKECVDLKGFEHGAAMALYLATDVS